eukprot:1159914-Pelagomonas_calceolata.AAC.4
MKECHTAPAVHPSMRSQAAIPGLPPAAEHRKHVLRSSSSASNHVQSGCHPRVATSCRAGKYA